MKHDQTSSDTLSSRRKFKSSALKRANDQFPASNFGMLNVPLLVTEVIDNQAKALRPKISVECAVTSPWTFQARAN